QAQGPRHGVETEFTRAGQSSELEQGDVAVRDPGCCSQAALAPAVGAAQRGDALAERRWSDGEGVGLGALHGLVCRVGKRLGTVAQRIGYAHDPEQQSALNTLASPEYYTDADRALTILSTTVLAQYREQ